MAEPYRSGKNTWSLRSRKGGEDYLISGQPSARAAKQAERDYLNGLEAKGRPVGLGPHATTLAQALSDWGLQRLPYLKGAPQMQRRINRYLRLADLPELVLEPALAEGADCDNPSIGKPGRRKRPKSRRRYFAVRLQEAHERDCERRIVASRKGHRAKLATKSLGSDRVRRRLANMRVADVMRHDVQQLVDAMRTEEAGIGTLEQEQALLRSFFYDAEEKWNWAAPARNPATALDMPAADNARSWVMTDDEERRLLSALSTARNRQATLVIRMLVETAMRCGEPLEHAFWGNLDWSRCVLRLDDGKAGARDVPLSPRAIELLRELHGVGPRRPLEPIVRVSYQALKKVWTRACERAEIYDLVLHDLRHTAATRLALRTGNPFLVKEQTGHKTWSQLMRYVNISADDVVKVLKELEPLAEGNVPDEQPKDTSGIASETSDALAEDGGSQRQDTGRHGANVVSVDFGSRQRFSTVLADPAASMPSHGDEGSPERHAKPARGFIGPTYPWHRRP